MPLQRCSSGGMSGWRYGKSGKCYIGPGAKKRAIKQGLAEVGGDSKKFAAEMGKAGLLDDLVVQEVLVESQPTGIGRILSGIAKEMEEKKYGELATADQKDFAVAYVSVEERKKMSLEDFGDPKRRRYPVKDQKHLNLAWDLSGREAPAAQKHIRQRLVKIAHRKGLKLPSTANKK